jgi:hypothetical protein
MGLLIESPQIARWISETLDNPTFDYEVQSDGNGGIQWVERYEDGKTVEYGTALGPNKMKNRCCRRMPCAGRQVLSADRLLMFR